MSTNEPAFPRDHRHDGHNGMDLRDYFAAKAMQSILSSSEWMLALREEVADRGGDTTDASALAQAAYEIADSMLKARLTRG